MRKEKIAIKYIYLDELMRGQGDQVGRILAYWTVVIFGQFLEFMQISCPNSESNVLVGTKNGLGYIFERFFHKLIWPP
jgi:hypothetical protein